MADLLIIHGGGPTAVLNASLYGAVKKACHRMRLDIFTVPIMVQEVF